MAAGVRFKLNAHARRSAWFGRDTYLPWPTYRELRGGPYIASTPGPWARRGHIFDGFAPGVFGSIGAHNAGRIFAQKDATCASPRVRVATYNFRPTGSVAQPNAVILLEHGAFSRAGWRWWWVGGVAGRQSPRPDIWTAICISQIHHQDLPLIANPSSPILERRKGCPPPLGVYARTEIRRLHRLRYVQYTIECWGRGDPLGRP